MRGFFFVILMFLIFLGVAYAVQKSNSDVRQAPDTNSPSLLSLLGAFLAATLLVAIV